MKQRGFTLIELLVASAILALLGALTGTLILNSLNNEQRITGHADQLQNIALGLSTLRRDLEQTVNRVARDERGDPQSAPMIGGRNGDTVLLQFSHTGRRQFPGRAPASELERVQYLLRDGDWIRLSSPYTDPAANSLWQSRRLFSDVDNVNLSFYDGSAWHGSWPPATTAVAGLPQALRIRFDSGEREAIELSILIAGEAT